MPGTKYDEIKKALEEVFKDNLIMNFEIDCNSEIHPINPSTEYVIKFKTHAKIKEQ